MKSAELKTVNLDSNRSSVAGNVDHGGSAAGEVGAWGCACVGSRTESMHHKEYMAHAEQSDLDFASLGDLC